MRACRRDQEKDSSSEGESDVHNDHPALHTIAKAHDNQAHALLRYVDELLRSKIKHFREMKPQINSVETQARCKVALQGTFGDIVRFMSTQTSQTRLSQKLNGEYVSGLWGTCKEATSSCCS